MGQEPMIEISPGDLPRVEPEPAPARRWAPTRPGDLHTPSDVPWGSGFGTPGPDTGYALKLVGDADFEIGEDEDRHNVEHFLLLIMGARASLFGKAPSADDMQFALMLAGLDSGPEIPDAVMTRLIADRRYWAPRVAHSRSKASILVGLLSPALLRLSVEDLRHRLALGEVPLTP